MNSTDSAHGYIHRLSSLNLSKYIIVWRKHGSLSKSPGNQWQLGFRPTPLGLCQRARVVERDVHVVLVRNRGWQGMLSNNKTTKAKEEKRGNGQKRGKWKMETRFKKRTTPMQKVWFLQRCCQMSKSWGNKASSQPGTTTTTGGEIMRLGETASNVHIRTKPGLSSVVSQPRC